MLAYVVDLDHQLIHIHINYCFDSKDLSLISMSPSTRIIWWQSFRCDFLHYIIVLFACNFAIPIRNPRQFTNSACLLLPFVVFAELPLSSTNALLCCCIVEASSWLSIEKVLQRCFVPFFLLFLLLLSCCYELSYSARCFLSTTTTNHCVDLCSMYHLMLGYFILAACDSSFSARGFSSLRNPQFTTGRSLFPP